MAVAYEERKTLNRGTTVALCIPSMRGDFEKGHVYRLKISVLTQIRPPDEIILVVSDAPEAFCKTMRRQFRGWVLVCFKKKMFAGPARNKAASLAKSEVVSFMDADDLMYPEKISMVHQYFDNRPGLQLFMHGFSSYVTEIPWTHRVVLYPVPTAKTMDGTAIFIEALASSLVHNTYVLGKAQHGHVSVRRSITEALSYNTKQGGQDSAYCRAVIRHVGNNSDGMIFVDVPLSAYTSRRHQDKKYEAEAPEDIFAGKPTNGKQAPSKPKKRPVSEKQNGKLKNKRKKADKKKKKKR